MWGDALSLLERAERMHRQYFRTAGGSIPSWEPAVDVVEDEGSVIVQVALPGIAAPAVNVELQADGLTVSGVRSFAVPRAAHIHRIEIPYGRFERHIPLPVQALGKAQMQLADGCLTVRFDKRKDSA
jgi:HSP20 family molecular chaperone IbpA